MHPRCTEPVWSVGSLLYLVATLLNDPIRALNLSTDDRTVP